MTIAAMMMEDRTVFMARGAPPPLALARRRVFDALPSGASLGPQALRTYRTYRTCCTRRTCPTRSDINDPSAIDDERAFRLHASRQDEIGARQHDHER